MTKFKNVFLLAAMAVSAVCVTSCSDDDDKPAGFSITAVVENGNDYNDKIDEVRVTVGDETVIGKYVNGGFTIVLPASVPDEYLALGFGIRSMSIGGRDFRPYNQGGLVAGVSFEYDAAFLYATESALLPSGREAVKKGWNKVYVTPGGNITTTPPSPAPKWSVYGN